MDLDEIATLDDAGFRRLITRHVHYTVGDPKVWELLHSPELIERTRTMLTTVYKQLNATMSRKRQEREEFQQDCYSRGAAGKADWFETKTEYERDRGRLVSLHKALQGRLADAGKIQKDVNRANSMALTNHARESLRVLSIAVQKHQAAHARSGTMAEQCDYELWRLLDRLTVPVGPANERVPLRTMLDFYWTDVEPVTEAQARVEELEPLVRRTPVGGAQAFAGVPKARHVGNDRKLA
ncbi:hypothetical protein ACFC1R_32295 [Kitasatospora sp. NPDC056138]|uniref:hypothetical protein n=1 Tax=Kitasatospora sp. NPDC056138 TaxID=3345724 RepID=UPI0035E190D0